MRIRVALFLIFAVAVLLVSGWAYQCIDTLHRLELVEGERDSWQRPAEVLRLLDVHEGSRVAEIGSGVGYFSLKLSESVGRSGCVYAVDIRRRPLLVLRLRGLLARRGNIETVLAGNDDPRLPDRALDAVLIANTYHEVQDRPSMLAHVRRSLAPEGRLIILDRAPSLVGASADQHHVALAAAEGEVRGAGFDVIHRLGEFAVDGDSQDWWLIVCREPR